MLTQTQIEFKTLDETDLSLMIEQAKRASAEQWEFYQLGVDFWLARGDYDRIEREAQKAEELDDQLGYLLEMRDAVVS